MSPVGWRQRRVYNFITSYQLEHQHAPSIREIGDGVGLSSTSSVAWHLSQLERKGLVTREPGTRGTVTVNKLVTVNRDDLAEVLLSPGGSPADDNGVTAWHRLMDQAGMW